MKHESQKIEVLIKQLARSYMQSHVITCSIVEDVERRNYLNISKNMIKSNTVQFLAHLLVLLAGRLYFHLEALLDFIGKFYVGPIQMADLRSR